MNARVIWAVLAAGLFAVAGLTMLDSFAGLFSFGMAALTIVIATPDRQPRT